ncbi:MAG: DUF2905 domain-containing protein [Rhodomicrobium sp.]|nr:DUF2905 domain-containing protein [Rhodomicrobium sp.]
MGKYLILTGLALIAAGAIRILAERIGLGRLPGGIVVERDNVRLYLPIATGIFISLTVSFIVWIIGRWR